MMPLASKSLLGSAITEDTPSHGKNKLRHESMLSIVQNACSPFGQEFLLLIFVVAHPGLQIFCSFSSIDNRKFLSSTKCCNGMQQNNTQLNCELSKNGEFTSILETSLLHLHRRLGMGNGHI
ncbi:hypothetical protein TWF788_004573 [Orbilia oligospora]|uniref:Uncharacterized protein n=1 Tax=Orbilia oligospora TaxID=2813651 RepID=A0A7C8P6H8_ORBOL|nr:hypothetical protein TWF788_004573 [Orbilia oligospora]